MFLVFGVGDKGPIAAVNSKMPGGFRGVCLLLVFPRILDNDKHN